MLPVVALQAGRVRFAVPLDRVIEVAPRVAVTPLPGVDAPVLGYVAYRGQAVPAVDLRLRLGRAPGPPTLDEHLLVVRARRRGSDDLRPVALLVDQVVELTEVDAARAAPPPESAVAVGGVLALPDGLLLLADLDRVLSLEEERAVDRALSELPERG